MGASEGPYSVVVGNIGTVHTTPQLGDARLTARIYVDRSKSGRGRCAGEPVYVFDAAGEIVDSYEVTDHAESLA